MRGGPWSSPVAAALLAAAAHAAEQPVQQVFRLSGACTYLNFLNGLLFKRQLNTTASGAPYYKAISSHYYIYYDPNCMGHSDGSPRWIIDSDEPSLTRATDLDGDGDCIFHALVSSGDLTRPPSSAMWRMYCDNLWVDRVVTLEDIPQLDHPTSTRTTTTGPPATSTSTTVLPRMLRLEGACDFLSFLNIATFLLEGSTATGAPYWKAMDHHYYIYFDPDCHGGMNGAPRWIIDNDAPDTQRLQDLDNDGDCMYHAHADSTNTVRPPEHASWSMFCNHQWTTRQISLFEVTTTTTTSTTTSSTTTSTTTTSSTTTTTVSSTTSTTVSTTLTTTTTSLTTSTTSTSTTSSATSTATATITSSITSTTSGTTTTATTAPAAASTSARSSQGDSPAAPSGEDDDADSRASCDSYACPLGLAMRPNASDIACGGATCGDEDNTTCCEEPSATTVAAAAVATTTEASSPADSTTHGDGTAEQLAQLLRLTGTCAEKAVLEGAVFALQGKTASGAPFYKAHVGSRDYYIYYDSACGGVDKGKPRWILDSDAPDTSRVQDLDGDGRCLYFARVDNQDVSRPPSSTTWRMHCGGTWKDVLLRLEAPTGTTAPPAVPTSAPSVQDPLAALLLNGVCNYQKYLNGLVFIKEGITASGAPFYKAESQDYYIYWDQHCDGRNESSPRWIIDTHRPSTSRSVDLDGDGECHFLARTISAASSVPPLDSNWRVYCENGWQDVHLDLQEAFAKIANGTCEAAGKVTIVDSHACSMAASYFNLSRGAPMSMPNPQGQTGCFWDAASSQLQLVTSSSHGAGHGAAHDGGHSTEAGHGGQAGHGGAAAGNGSDAVGHGGAAAGHGGDAAGHGGAAAGHGGDAAGHGGAAAGHGGDAAGHGGATAGHGGDAAGHGGAAAGHGGDAAGHGGAAAGHGGDAAAHGGETAAHGGEAANHGADHGAHSGSHRRLLAEPALEALCAGGHLAAPSHGHGQAAISAAAGLRGPAWALGVLALGLSSLAATA